MEIGADYADSSPFVGTFAHGTPPTPPTPVFELLCGYVYIALSVVLLGVVELRTRTFAPEKT